MYNICICEPKGSYFYPLVYINAKSHFYNYPVLS